MNESALIIGMLILAWASIGIASGVCADLLWFGKRITVGDLIFEIIVGSLAGPFAWLSILIALIFIHIPWPRFLSKTVWKND